MSQVVQINIFLLLWLLLLIWTAALAVVLLTICGKLHRHLISLSISQKLLMHEHVTLASSHVATIVSHHLLLLLLLLVMLSKMGVELRVGPIVTPAVQAHLTWVHLLVLLI